MVAYITLTVFGLVVFAISVWGVHENKKYLKEQAAANSKV